MTIVTLRLVDPDDDERSTILHRTLQARYDSYPLVVGDTILVPEIGSAVSILARTVHVEGTLELILSSYHPYGREHMDEVASALLRAGWSM